MKLIRGLFGIVIVGLISILTPVRAQVDPTYMRTEFEGAKKSIFEGRVKDGTNRLSTLLGKVDPKPIQATIISDALADILHQIEDYPEESQILAKLLSTNIANQNSPYFPRMQLNLGRNLAYTGRAEEAEKVLRASPWSEVSVVYGSAIGGLPINWQFSSNRYRLQEFER
jgi:hypothetical protein